MLPDSLKLLRAGELGSAEAEQILSDVGFTNWELAEERFAALCPDDASREALAECLPMLLIALSEAATPDESLVNFERYVQSVANRAELFEYLAENPRAVEILIKLFIGSQFLTEILLRNPDYLHQLTQYKRLAEFKSREQFIEEANKKATTADSVAEKLDMLRRYQQWELLRIGACDSFGLFNLKSITVQLSLLADALVQCCLNILADDLQISLTGFSVLAFGKLGGEELNYSSDIDLVFLADREAMRFWKIGQRLINALMKPTTEGFLYRVDMRLRPWGKSGALVNTVKAHIDYLKKDGRPWEFQALLKARVIAGEQQVGKDFLMQVEPIIFGMPKETVLQSVRKSKEMIEQELKKQGREWGEVKSGAGSIRDIEFITQCLQLLYGGKHPEVRGIGTLDGLVRLADFGFIHGNEYRQLTSGYIFLRKIEHALQLIHYNQVHSLPEKEMKRELTWLARRLDFPDSEMFISHYERHCAEIRAIYERYVSHPDEPVFEASINTTPRVSPHMTHMEPTYAETFSSEEIQNHAKMLSLISEENPAEMTVTATDNALWKLTIVGFDQVGDLSMMCGLLSVYGFNIVDGHVFSNATIRQAGKVDLPAGFVNEFTIKPLLDEVLPEVWRRYEHDLEELLVLLHQGNAQAAHGMMAKRVAHALRENLVTDAILYPLEVNIDNDLSEKATTLNIQGMDTIGFLYELTNALSLSNVNISNMTIQTEGAYVNDTLYVTDSAGNKITDAKRQQELQAAVVLIKHFTHLLPQSPNPESALLHFREFIEQLFQKPNWLDDLASINHSDVLAALAKLLGVSDFLWEDFLRLQHENLFPVLRDIDQLESRKLKQQLADELQSELENASDFETQKQKLNAFKDREMFRIDMRHILGHIHAFGDFSHELTHLADVVVAAAWQICNTELKQKYGTPQIKNATTGNKQECPFVICALGKHGGRELGFASDIELMFLYADNGKTTGPTVISNMEYFEKLVGLFRKTIQSRQEGIFQLDLRLRPYGRAGSLAVSRDAFATYFSIDGAAWPYERQALVKLRAIAGDMEFGDQMINLRDQLIYNGDPFDMEAMRAMREKQVNQLVQAGTINAKLSPGGLVDCEYLVQGLQITHGREHQELRTRSTRKGIYALWQAGFLSEEEYIELRDAYIFLRKLIDALRMVRGHAKDLTVPEVDTEEFEFLARRLGYASATSKLEADFEACRTTVLKFGDLLDQATGN